MQVQEVITRDVTTGSPDTSLKEVAATLVARRISGLPNCQPRLVRRP